jgi:hypothetical protein
MLTQEGERPPGGNPMTAPSESRPYRQEQGGSSVFSDGRDEEVNRSLGILEHLVRFAAICIVGLAFLFGSALLVTWAVQHVPLYGFAGLLVLVFYLIYREAQR